MKVLIVGGCPLIEQMFVDRGYEITTDEQEAELAVFTGGSDVSPDLYGEPNFASHNYPERDEVEKRKYLYLRDLGVSCVGICRGNQFLSVMNGCRMYQDIEGHAISGTHPTTDLETQEVINTTSTHHQSVYIPMGVNHELIAIANLGRRKSRYDEQVIHEVTSADVEVIFFPETMTLGVQFHPEYGVKECEDYFFSLLSRKLSIEVVQ